MSLVVSVVTKDGGVFLISPNGPLDSETYGTLEEKIEVILRLAPNVLVLDMGLVPYISSMGLNVVLKTKKNMVQRGKNFFIANMKPAVKKVFEVAATLPSFTIFSTVQEADKYLLKLQQKEEHKGKGPEKNDNI